MKKLSKYINKSNIIENYIDYSILQHLAIEYKENNLYSKNHIILEKYGVYNGCEELAQFIYDKVEKEGMDNQYEFTKDKLLKFSNIFFEKIIIDIDTSEDKGGEYLDNEELNSNLLFDEVIINLYLNENHLNQVKEILMHELTHAYNNYIMILKGDDGYIKTSKSVLYQNIQKLSSNDNEFLLKKALYLLLGYEKNTFFAEIKDELSQNKDKIKTPYDALNILKKSLIYQAYKNLDKQINDFFYNKLSENDIKEIETAYVKITQEKKTANQIFKTLRSLSKKTLKKLDNQLPKLCIENLNNILITDDTHMFEYLNN
jgi:hypothetical protein